MISMDEITMDFQYIQRMQGICYFVMSVILNF